MGQVLQLKGNEFFAIRDLYNELLKLPEGWKLSLIEGVAFLRVSNDKKKGRVKVAGKLAGVQFTLTVHDDSAVLITEQQCRDIVAFVYDIVIVLSEGVHKPLPDMPVLTEEEAQKWVERCVASSDEKCQIIAKNIVNMGNLPSNKKEGWLANKYRMKIKLPRDNDPLLKAFAQMYGSEETVAFYIKEMFKEAFYLVAMDNVLYYDSTRLEYFESIFNDVDRITMKNGLGDKYKQIKVQFPE
jgi:hypothetical protein